MTAKQAFQVWFEAMKAEKPLAEQDRLNAEYFRIKAEEARDVPVVRSVVRNNGRMFRVAVHANGTVSDLD